MNESDGAGPDAVLLLAAREIRPHLVELVGDDAGSIDAQLAEVLLSPMEHGDKVGQLSVVFASNSLLVDWLGQFVDAGLIAPEIGGGLARGVGPGLPGDPLVQSGLKFVCPNGDYVDYAVRKGEFMAPCPTCGLDLVPEGE